MSILCSTWDLVNVYIHHNNQESASAPATLVSWMAKYLRWQVVVMIETMHFRTYDTYKM